MKKNFILLFLICSFKNFIFAQTAKPIPKTGTTVQTSTKSTYTKIIDRGEMFYIIEAKKNIDALRKQFSEAFVQDILKYTDGDNWPEATANGLFQSEEDQQRIKSYKTYYISDLADNRVLLWIPSAENKHMPKEMQQEHDFFIVFGKAGVELGTKKMPTGAAKK